MVNWFFILFACIFISLDIVSGFIKACKTKTVDSKVMKEGLYHKSAFLLIIALATVCQLACAYGMAEYAGIDASIPIVEFVCGYVIATEAISILENCAEINPEVDKLKIMSIFKNR